MIKPYMTHTAEKVLKDIISLKNKRILFVGIGNVLKSDDGVGVYISKNIRKTAFIDSITVEVSIENYIGKINKLNPDILVLIDCMDMNKPPGTYKLLQVNDLNDHTFNTHNISLNRMSLFFQMPVFVLGIQPEILDFGEKISYIVYDSANIIINQINKEI